MGAFFWEEEMYVYICPVTAMGMCDSEVTHECNRLHTKFFADPPEA